MVKGNPQTIQTVQKRIDRLNVLIGKHVLYFLVGVAMMFFGFKVEEYWDAFTLVLLGGCTCLISVLMCIRAAFEIIFVRKELKVSKQESKGDL